MGAVKQAFLGRFNQLGWRDKLAVGFDFLRGAVHARFSQLLKLKHDAKQGDRVSSMVSPQDIATGANARSWTFGAAT
jgi:hypothetical protein